MVPVPVPGWCYREPVAFDPPKNHVIMATVVSLWGPSPGLQNTPFFGPNCPFSTAPVQHRYLAFPLRIVPNSLYDFGRFHGSKWVVPILRCNVWVLATELSDTNMPSSFRNQQHSSLLLEPEWVKRSGLEMVRPDEVVYLFTTTGTNRRESGLDSTTDCRSQKSCANHKLMFLWMGRPQYPNPNILTQIFRLE